MKKLHRRLAVKMQKRGWEPRHIEKALGILYNAEQKKHPYIRLLDRYLAWFALILIIGGNFIITLALVPFLIATPVAVTVVVTFFFGMCFGFMMDSIIRDIDSVSARHYIIAGIFIPVFSLVNILFASWIVQEVARYIKPVAHYNPLLIVTVYLASFSLPHILLKTAESNELSFEENAKRA